VPAQEVWDKSLRELAVASIVAALEDAGSPPVPLGALYVGNMLGGELADQAQLGALVADFAGLAGIEAFRIEAAGASGGVAFRQGALAVAAGVHDLVLVTGVEKMTERLDPEVTAALAHAHDGDYETFPGATPASLAAMIMQRYIHEYGVDRGDFAVFPLTAHQNAVNNPYAMYRRAITRAFYDRAAMVAEPLNMLDCSPTCDGSASVVLGPAQMARDRDWPVVKVVGSGIATDTIAIHDRADPLWLSAVARSATEAYRQAGKQPSDIDFFELYDDFTITAVLTLEASGFAARGQAVRFANEAGVGLDGQLPICTMGGLKGRGNPDGATGVYQIVDVVHQLRGEAGASQINCRVGMAQAIGGSGATAVTHILEVEK
jgi:acetyl-CoA C-acetyltransferase